MAYEVELEMRVACRTTLKLPRPSSAPKRKQLGPMAAPAGAPDELRLGADGLETVGAVAAASVDVVLLPLALVPVLLMLGVMPALPRRPAVTTKPVLLDRAWVGVRSGRPGELRPDDGDESL